MTNVISIHCTCDYLVKRAAKHRRGGRYDEAMALLWKARNQFGPQEDVLWEMAKVYDEIGCDEAAERAYLRLVRIRKKYRAESLFYLSLSSAQRGDFQRAASYFEAFQQEADHGEITDEMSEIFACQLIHENGHSQKKLSAKKRAKVLEKRAAASLQAGKVIAAQRALEHALRLNPSASRYTMLACCHLLRNRFDEAVSSAKLAHKKCPSDVQAMCVLADAYIASGQHQKAINAINFASILANKTDDLLAVCIESAKVGCDSLTLQITQRMLRIEPYHTRAMMLRACAYINRGNWKSAEHLLARLCGLLPENSICESYYRLVRDQHHFEERLSIGADVVREEGIERAAELIKLLYADPKEIDEDDSLCMKVCRLSDWAFFSPMAGPSTKMAALAVLAGLQSVEAKEVLLDLLLSPHLSDSLKLSALQVLTAKDGFYPYDVDMNGRLVRLAAGGVSTETVRSREANSRIVQCVADRLENKDAGAAQMLLDMYLAYVNVYGQPDKKHEKPCAAALEYWYMSSKERTVDAHRIAASYGVSTRIMHVYLQRFFCCDKEHKSIQQEE